MGIGGAYLCVYGMEGPGGYQFVGRTLQMWNRYHEVADFAGKPRLLRFSTSCVSIRSRRKNCWLFAAISRSDATRCASSTARCGWRSTSSFSREAQSISAFRDHQQRAFNDERERWIASGRAHFDSQESATEEAGDAPLQPGSRAESPVSGNLWQVQTAAGSRYAPAMCWWCLSR